MVEPHWITRTITFHLKRLNMGQDKSLNIHSYSSLYTFLYNYIYFNHLEIFWNEIKLSSPKYESGNYLAILFYVAKLGCRLHFNTCFLLLCCFFRRKTNNKIEFPVPARPFSCLNCSKFELLHIYLLVKHVETQYRMFTFD